MEIDVRNHFEVDSSDKGVWMHKPPAPGQTISHDEALLLSHLLFRACREHCTIPSIALSDALDAAASKPEGPAVTTASSGGAPTQPNTPDGA